MCNILSNANDLWKKYSNVQSYTVTMYGILIVNYRGVICLFAKRGY